MKKIIRLIIVPIAVVFCSNTHAQVGIGTTNPISSAELDVYSTTKGFLPPRMTHAQKMGIISPVAGLLLWCTDCGSNGEMQVYNGTSWSNMIGGTAAIYPCGSISVTFLYNGSTVTNNTVLSAGSRCWLDRNLGATQVAGSSTDALSYGDLFQWGRSMDGHQIKTSATSLLQSNSDMPGNIFIKGFSDWRNPENSTLWQVVNGANNPCPNGFRIPTEQEMNTEILSWSSNNSGGAFNSPLKLPSAGKRFSGTAALNSIGSAGFYWTSGTLNNNRLFFSNVNALMQIDYRATGCSVRCIKD
jgi:uncharacterized protein (TIGR02145 family)